MAEMQELEKEIQILAEKGNLRSLHPLAARNLCSVDAGGGRVLNMSSNDYLGIAGDVELHHAFYHDLQDTASLLDNYALGSASSRLLTGDTPSYHLLEETIATAYGAEACLFFNSGYHANIGILPALTGRGDLILSDKLNHASLHDGFRLSRAETKRFRHLDYEQLEELLKKYRQSYRRVVIVTESVFSMDGDKADLLALVALKERYDCLLYVDEAHAVGVAGKLGLGEAEAQGVCGQIDLLIGTFGKAFASIGAYVVCTQILHDVLLNSSRSFIFTTALPPVVVHWNYFIFSRSLGMTERRERLRLLAPQLRAGLGEYDLQTGGTTQIVPVMIGDNAMAVALAEKLQKHGYHILAVRPPTVPQGTARFRLSLSATMEWDMLKELPALIADEIRTYAD